MPPARPAAAGILALCLATALTAAGRFRAPVELLSPRVQPPVEAAGSGVAPEVHVQVTVGADGRVGEVRILGIEPSTRFDEPFARAVRETLAGWRYAPKLEDGKPVAAELSWTISFPKTEGAYVPHVGMLPLVPADTVFTAGADAEVRRARFRELAFEQRRTLLEEITGRALAVMPGTGRAEVETGRFRVWSDGGEKTAQAVASNLEAVFAFMASFFGPDIPLQTQPYKIMVFAFTRQADYQALRNTSESFEWSAGYYHPAGALALTLEQPTSDAVLGTLMHEAAHAFLDLFVVRPGVALPRWLGEGFADYIGNSRVEKGKLVPGKTRRRQIYLTREGAVVGTTVAGMDVGQVKRELRRRNGLSLEDILEADREIFYGPRREQFYPLAWMLVHYLQHADPEWTDLFPGFLTYVAEGYPATAALEAVYGRPARAFGPEFERYAMGF